MFLSKSVAAFMFYILNMFSQNTCTILCNLKKYIDEKKRIKQQTILCPNVSSNFTVKRLTSSFSLFYDGIRRCASEKQNSFHYFISVFLIAIYKNMWGFIFLCSCKQGFSEVQTVFLSHAEPLHCVQLGKVSMLVWKIIG